jgi:hypothetical protein
VNFDAIGQICTGNADCSGTLCFMGTCSLACATDLECKVGAALVGLCNRVDPAGAQFCAEACDCSHPCRTSLTCTQQGVCSTDPAGALPCN